MLLLPVEVLAILHVRQPYRVKYEQLLTLGGFSNSACRSRMRLAEPLIRNVPCTSVAAITAYEHMASCTF